MGTREGLHSAATSIGARPITFWLLIGSMTILGPTILGVGKRWPIVATFNRIIGND